MLVYSIRYYGVATSASVAATTTVVASITTTVRVCFTKYIERSRDPVGAPMHPGCR